MLAIPGWPGIPSSLLASVLQAASSTFYCEDLRLFSRPCETYTTHWLRQSFTLIANSKLRIAKPLQRRQTHPRQPPGVSSERQAPSPSTVKRRNHALRGPLTLRRARNSALGAEHPSGGSPEARGPY